jgi:hypothetical protein
MTAVTRTTFVRESARCRERLSDVRVASAQLARAFLKIGYAAQATEALLSICERSIEDGLPVDFDVTRQLRQLLLQLAASTSNAHLAASTNLFLGEEVMQRALDLVGTGDQDVQSGIAAGLYSSTATLFPLLNEVYNVS